MSDDSDDLSRHYREEWMSDDQWRCALMLADLRRGFHHLGTKIRPCGRGIEINSRYGNWATFDGSDLTRAVILAHDRMIRLEIAPSGPGMLKLRLWQRQGRVGGVCERHPTIEDAIASARNGRTSA